MTRLRGELATTKQQLKLQNLETKAQVSDKMDVTVQQVNNWRVSGVKCKDHCV